MNRAKLEVLRDSLRARDWNRLAVGAPEVVILLDALLEAAPAAACPCGLCREGGGAPLTAAETEGAILEHRVQRAQREPATPLYGPTTLTGLSEREWEETQRHAVAPRWGADGADTAWRESQENEPYRAWQARRLVENWSA